jgi:hypothetical protein
MSRTQFLLNFFRISNPLTVWWRSAAQLIGEARMVIEHLQLFVPDFSYHTGR